MGYMERYKEWIERLPEEDPMREELIEIEGNDAEIKDRFYKEIEFGTAGLRGICGAGTNRMNTLTVGRATQGIANYILSSGENPARGFAIAYDCRYHSQEQPATIPRSTTDTRSIGWTARRFPARCRTAC